MRALRWTVMALVLAFQASICSAQAPLGSSQVSLQAGAAKLDITPDKKDWPPHIEGVLDPVHVRALVLDDGKTRAAMVTVDSVALTTESWDHITAAAERELHIPRKQFLLSASHSHSAFFKGEAFEKQVLTALREAAVKLEPATVSYGTGRSYINVNRNMVDKQSHQWREGPNYDGPSDKTVAVLRFSNIDGTPIAVYYNYAVHGVVTGMLDQFSGDIPGVTSDYIENALGDDAVALWSMGAAGDQNPIFFQQTYDLRAIRVANFAKKGEDISNSMPPGGQGLNKNNPVIAKLFDQQKQMVNTYGQMLGEEVLHVLRANMERPQASADLEGVQESVTCPGRTRTDSGRAGHPGTYVDGKPVDIRLGVLRIGDTIIGAVDAELFTMIGQRFKRESPYKHTILATLTNGASSSGYIPDEAAFGYNTFEVLSSKVKPGCAEGAIVNGLLDLINETDQMERAD
ncbi:hypothetical protein GRI39_11780 [Altererythrobacter indicus]|uniref:Neutral/alkaline non-lysosomal ceramidase N-terminal domain-containing protein n=1 Tax=Altericroceibacterium indicum TaxID=374177 RepID=A0A845AD53_9SPHN|nr:hypothetical protein [Altericroceibacterium indicum]